MKFLYVMYSLDNLCDLIVPTYYSVSIPIIKMMDIIRIFISTESKKTKVQQRKKNKHHKHTGECETNKKKKTTHQEIAQITHQQQKR